MRSSLARSFVVLVAIGGLAYALPPGSRSWSSSHAAEDGSSSAVGVANETHRVFVAGRIQTGRSFGNQDFFVRALSARRGHLLWQDRFDLAGHNDEVGGVAVDAGIVFVGGYATSTAGDTEVLVRAHDAGSGRLLWQATSSSTERSEAIEAMAATGGRAFAVGRTDIDDDSDVLVIAFLGRAGTTAWSDTFDLGGGFDTARAIAVGDRRLVVAGSGATRRGDSNALVLTYEATTGELLWTHAFGSTGFDQIQSVALAGPRRVAVAAVTEGSPSDRGIELRVLRGSGKVAWRKRLGAGDGFDQAGGLAADARTVWVAGAMAGPAGTSPFLQAYRSRDGRPLWEASGPDVGPGARFDDLIVTEDAVIAAGTAPTADGTGIVIAAYDPRTGALLWSDLRDPANGSEGAAALVAVPGNVVVVGTHARPGGGKTAKTALVARAWGR